MVNHVRRFTLASRENPVLLMLDNHDSHLSFNVIELARENVIHIVTFSPHCSHKLQPLDIFHRLQWQISKPGDWNISSKLNDISRFRVRCINGVYTYLISEVDVQEVNEVNIPVNVNDESQKRSSNSDDLQNRE